MRSRPESPRRPSSLLALAALAALCLAGAPAAEAKRATGIDVSRFQGTIDWAQVRGAGVGFAFVQASRGSGEDCAVVPASCGADPYFAANRANAQANGVRVGPYHRAFATGSTIAEARADAAAEAAVFIGSVGALNRGELIPVLDVETPFTGLNAKRLSAWIRVWVKRVRRALGRKAMIYTNASSWGATGNTREFAKARYPLWVAEWGVRRPTVPALNWAGRGWSVWQWTSSGSVSGINGRVDMNRLGVRLKKLIVR
jgi:GH25 family lysozyme M1 (1,4-beta-N-acetylmuramidase)